MRHYRPFVLSLQLMLIGALAAARSPGWLRRVLWLAALLLAGEADATPLPSAEALHAKVHAVMQQTGARGLAVALVDAGQVVATHTYGERNASGDPLRRDTVMYGASLTKAAFAYYVMQLVDEGQLDLDRPIAALFDSPLPTHAPAYGYGPWQDLAGDERWRAITPRMLLSHSAGFANFAFVEPDGKLRIHFAPGQRYAYSGEGFILLQYALHRGLVLDVGQEMQRRVFERFGMTRTSMTWRPEFAANLADGWDIEGKPRPHDERSKVRAAGSMDTTIDDIARFAAGYVRGGGLSPNARRELVRAQLAIDSASQFPSLQPPLSPEQRRADLAAGLGVIVFEGPQGPGFMKGGHDDITANMWVCVERTQRCVVVLSNDVRIERAYPALVDFVLGEAGVPWAWEYGSRGG